VSSLKDEKLIKKANPHENGNILESFEYSAKYHENQSL